ncbi:MAG: hypothetical protein ACE5KM_05525 [Planctomycetaceae bacterium]
MSRPPGSILKFAALIAVCGVGCRTFVATTAVAPSQPFFVSAGDSETVWEQIVDVLHDYPFEIERETKLDGIIETKYKVGAGLAEPWHRDSVGLYNRLESSLQSIRRKVFVTMTRTDGGFVITVRADKDIQNLNIPRANSVGGATFQENQPLQRDLDAVVGNQSGNGWSHRGRDFALEQDLTARLRSALLR